MISVILSPIIVGQHQDNIGLLKEVFNTKPPQKDIFQNGTQGLASPVFKPISKI